MTARRASLYVRLSREANRENLSLEGMVADLRALVAREEFVEVALHVDDGISGAVRDRKEFQAWLDDARDGRADVLATPHADRLSREGLNVAATILDVVEGKHPATGKVTGRPVRLMDTGGLDSDDGEGFRMRYIVQAEVARGERGRMVERSRRTKARLAEAGRFPGGPTPYGYVSVEHPAGAGRALAVDPIEAEHIKAAAEHILAGRSMYSAITMMHDRGSRPRRARGWSVKSLGIVLTGDAVLGRVTRLGELRRDDFGQPLVVWEPVLAVEEVARLRAALEPKPRGKSRRRATRLLSGRLRCLECGSPMRLRVTGGVKQKAAAYRCSGKIDGTGCTTTPSITADRIEEYIEADYLESYGDLPMMRRVDSLPEDDRLAATERAIDETTTAMRRDDADVVALAERLVELKALRGDLRTRVGTRVTVMEHVGMTYREAWEAGDVEERRTIIAAMYPSIRIGPGVRGRNGLDETRVRILHSPALIEGYSEALTPGQVILEDPDPEGNDPFAEWGTVPASLAATLDPAALERYALGID